MTNASITKTLLEEARFNQKTKLPFNKDEALKRGMLYQKGIYVLIVWDTMSEPLKNLAKVLEGSGNSIVKFSAKNETEFKGEELREYDFVIHLNGTTYNTEMPKEGQQALVEFVREGGFFMTGNWNAYEADRNRMLDMIDLILYTRTSSRTTPAVFVSANKKAETHPLLDGLTVPLNITASASFNVGDLREFATEGSEAVLFQKDTTNPILAVRKLGKGQVINLAIAVNYNNSTVLNEKAIQQIYLNAVDWAVE